MSEWLSPPLTALADLTATLARQGYAVLSAGDVVQGMLQSHRSRYAIDSNIDSLQKAMQQMLPSWSDLPPDAYLKDGGRYRRRRHSCFVVDEGMVQLQPHRAHWQPVAYNALHGGMQRLFAPMDAQILNLAAWSHLLRWLSDVTSALRGPQPWFVEAHQFRIDTTDGIGRPTPEGAHRDGVDLVAVFMIARQGVKGGETRVFDAHSPHGQRFTLTEPWSVLLLDDARVIHETTPIQPQTPGQAAYRDTLVLTLRAGGFQGEGLVD
jgi:hypothetical protein